MANKNRDKGHRYERWWANIFKDLGWEKCITARQGSRIMDDSGIDLINIPYNMQLKYGYPRGINYKTLFDSIDACKEKNFMDDECLVRLKSNKLTPKLSFFIQRIF